MWGRSVLSILEERDRKPEQSLDEVFELAHLFHNHGVNYWLDSGTLLGVIRDGCLLKGDDIDVSVWETDEAALSSILRELRNQYSIRTMRYRGRIVYCWLRPRQAHRRPIDIKVFRRVGDFAWCPSVQLVDRFVENRFAFFAWRLLRAFIWRVWAYVLPWISPNSWPLRYFVSVGCWWIPARFFEDIKILENGLRIPYDVDEYLGYRYGDWRTPVENWDFRANDPAFRMESPEELVSEVTS